MSNKHPNHDLSPMACPVRLEDVDLFSEGAQEHWYEAYEILHREAPVYRIPGEGFEPGTDGFVLTKYEDIARVVRDWDRFPPTMSFGVKNLMESDTPPEQIPHLNTMVLSMTTLRPNQELWRSHRQELTDPWVGPGASRHEAMIRGHAQELIGNWIDQDEVEFIGEFARPLPQRVMATVLGFPLEDLPRLEAWGNAQVTPFVYGKGHRNLLTEDQLDEQFQVLDEFKAYVAEQIQKKRDQPAEDMISFLTDVTYKPLGRKLTDLEINGVVYAMVIGGLETTQYALEEEAQLLCEREGLWDALKADRKKLRQFIEESLRVRSPTQGLSTPGHQSGRGVPGGDRAQGVAAAPALGGGQHRRGGVRVPARSAARPQGRQPSPGLFGRAAGLPGRQHLAAGATRRLELPHGPARFHRVRVGQHLPAPAGHHAGDPGAESQNPARLSGSVDSGLVLG